MGLLTSLFQFQTFDEDAQVKRILSCSSHYEVLGIQPTATSGEIKKAYFQHARKLHPDKNVSKGSDGAFKILNRAYETLKDAEQRKVYDALLADGRGNINIDPLKATTIVRVRKEE